MRSTSCFTSMLFALLFLFCAANVQAQRYYADYYYIPPPALEAEKSMRQDAHALAPSKIAVYLGAARPVYTLENEQSASSAMKQLAAQAPSHQVAAGKRLDLEAADLFGDSMFDGTGFAFLVEIRSVGAHALRLKADLAGLLDDEFLWMLDPDGETAFGPYGPSSPDVGDGWLPTTLGQSVVLALTSPRDRLPLFLIEGASHFFRPLFNKQFIPTPLSCNIPIDQESNSVLQKISSGVGLMIVPFGYDQGYCTSTLLNSAEGVDGVPAPYLLSAWHCFGNSANYAGIEVVWDYRAAEAVVDRNLFLSALPKTTGAQLVSINQTLDVALIKLASTPPIGDFGRAWAGWDSAVPGVGEKVQNVHFPQGDAMKTSKGNIMAVGTEVCMNTFCSPAYEQQLNILWREGVTEQGSSGSALLLADQNFRVAGVLSNGTAHDCADTANNYDNFGSFAMFFPEIGCHLVADYDCVEPYKPARRSCFLMRLLGLKSETLENVRLFRDQALKKGRWGQQLIRDYYALAPQLEAWLSRDVLARTIFKGLVGGASAWGGALRP